jgi:uncharacterized protein
LLAIKSGAFEYDDLVAQATELKEELPELYQKADLMDEPDLEKIEQVLVKMREVYYGEK